MKKKMVLFLVVSLFITSILSACAPDRRSVEQNKNNEKGGEKPEQLVLWSPEAEEQLNAVKKIVKNFEEETGIQVKVKPVGMLEQTKKLALAGPAGNGPDVFYQPHDRIGDIVAQGLAVPLNLNEDLKQEYSDVAVQAVTYEGKIYGAPAVIETYALFYNKSFISEPPQTLDELFQVAEKHTNPSQKQYGFLIEPNFYYTFPFWKNYGGYVFAMESGKYNIHDIGLNNEGAIQGASMYQNFYDKNLIPQKLTADILNGLFTDGKAAMVVSGPWNIVPYKEALGAEKVATAPLPDLNGEPAHSFVGVKAYMVSYYSKYPEWAQKLALYLTNDESAQIYHDISGELVPRPEVLSSINDPIYNGFIKQIESGVPMPNVPAMSQVWEPMNAAHQFLAKGQNVEAVLDEAVQKIKQQIQATGQ